MKRRGRDFLNDSFLFFKEYREGDTPEAILKSFLAVDSELKSYGNATEMTGSTGQWQIGNLI